MKRTKRLLTMLLTLVLCLGEISATGLKVFAADEKTITGLGTGAITDPVVLDDIYEYWSGSYVYYGKYNGSDPTLYRVLDKDSNDFGVPGGSLFLDCNTTLFQAAHGKYDAHSKLVTEWKNSCIKRLLNGDGFLKKAGNLTAVEEDAIAESTNGSGTGALCGEKIFCLSETEACFTKYGYLSGVDSYSLSKGDDWWLRDIREWGFGGYYGLFFNSGGQIEFPTDPDSSMDFEAGVSPAFNISLSSIISSTLVSGKAGKSDAYYKLTLKDDLLSITAEMAKKEGNTIVIPYKITDNSDDVDPTQVSVIVTKGTWNGDTWDAGTKLLQYTRLKSASFSLNGNGTFVLDSEISGTWGVDYHVYILAEEVNGVKDTDYASEPVEVAVPCDLKVGGIQVTYANMDSIPCDSGKVSYNPKTKTLTLDNAVLTKADSGTYIIESKDDLTIEGTGMLVNPEAKAAIFVNKSGASLKLDADLDIKVAYSGVFSLSGEIEFAGGDISIETTADEGFGITASKLVFSGGNVEVVSKIVGIYALEGIYITGGTIDAVGDVVAVATLTGKPIAIGSKLEMTSPTGGTIGNVVIDDATYNAILDDEGNAATSVKIEPKKVEYTITFDANKKTATDMPAAQTVTEGNKATNPDKAPKAEGFAFDGWYTSADCKDSEKYDFSSAVTSNVTLYAKWTTEKVNVTGVTLSDTTLSLEEGADKTLTVTVAPDEATDKTVTWTTGNAAVATVDTTGKITAVAAGNAVIIATATNGTTDAADDKMATCIVTVTKAAAPKTDVSSVTLSKTALTLEKGTTGNLTATVEPDGATDKTVTWKSGDTSVATVDGSGKVTAVKAGTATITVTATNGTADTADDKTATCTVTVTEEPIPKTDVSGVTLNKATLDLQEGTTGTLAATVAPAEASDKTVIWTSGDTAIATVDKDGKVTAVKAGTVTITVTATNGTEETEDDKTASCEVTVTDPASEVTGDTLEKQEDGSLRYLKDGNWQSAYTGLVSIEGIWYYIENGVWIQDKYAFIEYEGYLFLVANGVLAQVNGLQMDPNGDNWYFCAEGQVVKHTGLVEYDDEWFYVENGVLDTGLNALVEYDGGLFYVAAGRIVRDKSGLAQDPNTSDWYFLALGEVQVQYTGLAFYDDEWFYVEKGKLAVDYTGPVEYDGEIFNVVSGMVK